MKTAQEYMKISIDNFAERAHILIDDVYKEVERRSQKGFTTATCYYTEEYNRTLDSGIKKYITDALGGNGFFCVWSPAAEPKPYIYITWYC